MKISASSSLLLATLAISSSSGSLAAPAGESAQSGGISPSSSARSLAGRRLSIVEQRDIRAGFTSGEHQKRAVPPDFSQVKSRTSNLQDRDVLGLVNLLTGLPVIGPLAKSVLGKLCDGASTASVEEMSEEDMAMVKEAIDVATQAINNKLGVSAREFKRDSAVHGASNSSSSAVPSSTATMSAAAASETSPSANPLVPNLPNLPVSLPVALPALPGTLPAVPALPANPAGVLPLPLKVPARRGLAGRVAVPVPAAVGKLPVGGNKPPSNQSQPSPTAAAAEGVDDAMPSATSSSISAPNSTTASAAPTQTSMSTGL